MSYCTILLPHSDRATARPLLHVTKAADPVDQRPPHERRRMSPRGYE